MKKLLILGMLAALACAAYAYPTLGGPTGLVTVPDATVVPTGQLQIAVDWWNLESDDAIIPLRLLYGVNDSLELGATFTTSEATGSDDVWSINAKFVTPLQLADSTMAVGASYAQDGDDVLTVYGALSKEFNENFAGTAALQWDDATEDFMLGIGGKATLDNGLILVGEYVNAMPGAAVNFAARYPLTDALTAQIGVINALDSVTIGLNYAFGVAE